MPATHRNDFPAAGQTGSDLSAYRASERERVRVGDLLDLVPTGLASGLDVGARDGHLSRLLADVVGEVTALDLELPVIDDARIRCVKGNVTSLDFTDGQFDLVFCAEVLEHIPPQLLARACRELVRVSRRHLVIGVPYRQDIRLGRTTCQCCGTINPPWGHVTSFDEKLLGQLFAGTTIRRTRFVGQTRAVTNAYSTALLDYAGNPYGTYGQLETCIACNQLLGQPGPRSLSQRAATRLGVMLQQMQARFEPPRGNWIHLLLEKA